MPLDYSVFISYQNKLLESYILANSILFLQHLVDRIIMQKKTKKPTQTRKHVCILETLLRKQRKKKHFFD